MEIRVPTRVKLSEQKGPGRANRALQLTWPDSWAGHQQGSQRGLLAGRPRYGVLIAATTDRTPLSGPGGSDLRSHTHSIPAFSCTLKGRKPLERELSEQGRWAWPSPGNSSCGHFKDPETQLVSSDMCKFAQPLATNWSLEPETARPAHAGPGGAQKAESPATSSAGTTAAGGDVQEVSSGSL